MVTQEIKLQNPERFSKPHVIPKEKLEKALKIACERLARMAKEHGVTFPNAFSTDYRYTFHENKNWVDGMYTGCFWLAYKLTGDEFFKEEGLKQLATYRPRLENRVGVDDHDVGFGYTPSCVNAYRFFGDKEARQTALDAAEYFYNTGYSQEGKFIIRVWKSWKLKGDPGGCRTMMDSLMNAPLFYWASEETGDPKYKIAGSDHTKTTAQYLIREDASSNHHYQFDPVTCAPLHGVTLQGHSDDSCWTRGHSWGVYGFPTAYSYTGEEYLIQLHKDITYYMLNHLPEDLVPYWDYDFIEGDEPRDASAALIAVCGMLEMNRYLPDDAEQKPIFASAAAQMLESVIDNYTSDIEGGFDGLVHHVTASKPHGMGIDGSAVYGDYFYLEALARYLLPEEEHYW